MAESTPQTETTPLAFQYNGMFTLAFLLYDESVRGAGEVAPKHCIKISWPTGSCFAVPGQWIVRSPGGRPMVLDADVATAIREHTLEFPVPAHA